MAHGRPRLHACESACHSANTFHPSCLYIPPHAALENRPASALMTPPLPNLRLTKAAHSNPALCPHLLLAIFHDSRRFCCTASSRMSRTNLAALLAADAASSPAAAAGFGGGGAAAWLGRRIDGRVQQKQGLQACSHTAPWLTNRLAAAGREAAARRAAISCSARRRSDHLLQRATAARPGRRRPAA